MREKNKFKTRFALVERNASKISGRWVFDTDEVVVAHTHMSEEDFFELFKFRLWGQVSYAAGYLKEIIMHCLNYDISPLELYDELLYDHESYSFINRLMNEYIENVRPLFFDSLNELENKLASHIEEFGNVDLFCYRRHLQIMEATICSSKNKSTFVSEVVEAAKSVFLKKYQSVDIRSDQFCDYAHILNKLHEIQVTSIISPLEPNNEIEQQRFDYDLVKWVDDDFVNPLSNYKLSEPRTFELVVRNIKEHQKCIDIVSDYPSLPLKYEYYYNSMVSSNMRRYIRLPAAPG